MNQLLMDYLADRLLQRHSNDTDPPDAAELARIMSEFRPPDTTVPCEGGIKEATLICKDVKFHFENNELTLIEIPNDIRGVTAILPMNDQYMAVENR